MNLSRSDLVTVRLNYPKRGIFADPSDGYQVTTCRELAFEIADDTNELVFLCREREIPLKTFIQRFAKIIGISFSISTIQSDKFTGILAKNLRNTLDIEVFTLLCRAYDIADNTNIKSWSAFERGVDNHILFNPATLFFLKYYKKLQQYVDHSDLLESNGLVNYLLSEEWVSQLNINFNPEQISLSAMKKAVSL